MFDDWHQFQSIDQAWLIENKKKNEFICQLFDLRSLVLTSIDESFSLLLRLLFFIRFSFVYPWKYRHIINLHLRQRWMFSLQDEERRSLIEWTSLMCDSSLIIREERKNGATIKRSNAIDHAEHVNIDLHTLTKTVDRWNFEFTTKIFHSRSLL